MVKQIKMGNNSVETDNENKTSLLLIAFKRPIELE